MHFLSIRDFHKIPDGRNKIDRIDPQDCQKMHARKNDENPH